jgi:hypothetical protein
MTRWLIAYNQNNVFELLREVSPDGLWQAVSCGAFGARLSQAERQELAALFEAWHQRALGQVMLRDALLVDPQRGERVYSLLCAAQTVARLPLPDAVELGVGEPTPEVLRTIGGSLAGLEERARTEGLQLWVIAANGTISLPKACIEALLPDKPQAMRPMPFTFEQPGGLRRNIALLLASAGALSLIIPLIFGNIPDQAAGLPLALLTLALLVGIRSGWPGYLGSSLIWSVPNLPGFHYEALHLLWPAIPLLSVGLILLALDKQIRAMWRWIRSRK